MSQAAKRLERAVTLGTRVQELQRQVKRAIAQLALVDEQCAGLEFEIRQELVGARAAVLDEQAHHMDPHQTAESVIGMRQ